MVGDIRGTNLSINHNNTTRGKGRHLVQGIPGVSVALVLPQPEIVSNRKRFRPDIPNTALPFTYLGARLLHQNPLNVELAQTISTPVRRVGGVVTQRIANPCTPVRFRYSPLMFSISYASFSHHHLPDPQQRPQHSCFVFVLFRANNRAKLRGHFRPKAHSHS